MKSWDISYPKQGIADDNAVDIGQIQHQLACLLLPKFLAESTGEVRLRQPSTAIFMSHDHDDDEDDTLCWIKLIFCKALLVLIPNLT